MKLLVVGAAGRVGRHVTTLALEAGHDVLALVRDPMKLAVTHPRLTVVRGDATDQDAIARAAPDCDAAISAIGGRRVEGPRSFIEDATRGIVRGLEATGVKRLVTIGSKGLSPGPGDLLLGDVTMPPALRNAFDDHKRAFAILRTSTLQWTVICPPHMPEGPVTRDYQVAVDGFPEPYGPITTGDVAHAALRALDEPGWVAKRVGVASR